MTRSTSKASTSQVVTESQLSASSPAGSRTLWRVYELEKLIEWMGRNTDLLGGKQGAWHRIVANDVFASEDHITEKKVKEKSGNMKKSYKKAKVMQSRHGWGMKEVDNPDDVNVTLERKCPYFWRLDAIYGRASTYGKLGLDGVSLSGDEHHYPTLRPLAAKRTEMEIGDEIGVTNDTVDMDYDDFSRVAGHLPERGHDEEDREEEVDEATNTENPKEDRPICGDRRQNALKIIQSRDRCDANSDDHEDQISSSPTANPSPPPRGLLNTKRGRSSTTLGLKRMVGDREIQRDIRESKRLRAEASLVGKKLEIEERIAAADRELARQIADADREMKKELATADRQLKRELAEMQSASIERMARMQQDMLTFIATHFSDRNRQG